MKTLGICAMMALATLSVAPAFADDAAYSKAVALAAEDSEASIEEISLALFYAVEESPEQAAGMLGMVLDQRRDWSKEDVHSLILAVMMAHPDLTIPVKEHISGEGAEGGADTATAPVAGLTLADGVEGTMLGEVIKSVYKADLPEGVAQSAMLSSGLSEHVVGYNAPASDSAATPSTPAGNSPAADAPEADEPEIIVADMTQLNMSVISGTLGGGTAAEEVKEPAVNPPAAGIPTPGPASPQN